MSDLRRERELALLWGEVVRALRHPRAFAASLREPRHGVGVVIVAIVCGAAFALAVDALTLASGGRAPHEHLAVLVTDVVLVGLRAAIVAAIAAAAVAGALRLARTPLDIASAYAATGFSLAWLVPLPGVVAAALVLHVPLLAVLGGLACLAAVVAALVLDLGAFVRGARLAFAVAAALAVLAVGLGERVQAGAVGLASAVPATLAPLPASAASGTPRGGAEHALLLAPEWRDATTGSAGELAAYASDRESLGVVRLRPAPLQTLADEADDLLRDELRGADLRRSDRGYWRVRDRLVIEDLRVAVNGDVDVVVALYSTRGARGAIGLLFRANRTSDLAAHLPGWRAAAASLVLPVDAAP
ncbi:MAG TPA: hypothetical protein VFM93_11570 [Candidatus Limnocylindria bacterium]|nr:hypothetical protein [Candidatus Limnocylindria bacterium]